MTQNKHRSIKNYSMFDMYQGAPSFLILMKTNMLLNVFGEREASFAKSWNETTKGHYHVGEFLDILEGLVGTSNPWRLELFLSWPLYCGKIPSISNFCLLKCTLCWADFDCRSPSNLLHQQTSVLLFRVICVIKNLWSTYLAQYKVLRWRAKVASLWGDHAPSNE